LKIDEDKQMMTLPFETYNAMIITISTIVNIQKDIMEVQKNIHAIIEHLNED